MSDPFKCQRCGQKSMSIDDSLLCGGCRQESPFLMAVSEREKQPDTIESLHESACKLTEMLDEAEARIAELEKALEPFAWGSDCYQAAIEDDQPTEIRTLVGNIRRAAALLNKE